jgi:superfamily II DNA or RNA helicase
MVSITIGNSSCKIIGLDQDNSSKLKKLLSYVPANNNYGMAHIYRRYLISARGEFPTGLLYLVQDYLRKNKLAFKCIDTRVKPVSKPGFVAQLGVVPHPEQKEAGEAAKRFGRGIIVAPTGTGKSLIAILIIQAVKVNTLVVVPGIELKRQLLESLTAAFGSNFVGTLDENKPIAVENVDSLDPKQPLKNYDCVIIDEFHHSGAASYRELNKHAWNNVYYKFGLTATPFRSRDEERLLLESVLSQVIYRIEYQTAVKNKYIVPMEAYYLEIPTTEEIQGNQRSWPAMYSELVVHNKIRNELIVKLLNTLKEADVSTLCLVKEIAHGQNLVEMDESLQFTNGTDEESREFIKLFNQEKIKILVGTTGVLGEGIDTKPCEWVIISGMGKSKNAFMQACGRAFRNFKNKQSCKIVIIKDNSHKWTKAHFAAQVKILKEEYNIKPIKLSLT